MPSKDGLPDHLVIPDTQTKPGVPLDHLVALGNYIVEKQPKVIVHLGDHADMPSLSFYDSPGRKGFEQRDVEADTAFANEALALIMAPTKAYNRKRNAKRRYKPRLILTLGNHEYRIDRLMNEKPWMRGALQGLLKYDQLGWEVYPFLTPVMVDGIVYCHFFCASADGRVKQSKRGQANARLQVQRIQQSCTAGHQQGLDVHIQPHLTGRRRGIIAGSFYLHDEEYLTAQGNLGHWRGALHKHGVEDGDYNLNEISLRYLLKAYG